MGYDVTNGTMQCRTMPAQRPCKGGACSRPECRIGRKNSGPFTVDELRMIRAMCLSANPRYPDVDMMRPWREIYDKAGAHLKALGE